MFDLIVMIIKLLFSVISKPYKIHFKAFKIVLHVCLYIMLPIIALYVNFTLSWHYSILRLMVYFRVILGIINKYDIYHIYYIYAKNLKNPAWF